MRRPKNSRYGRIYRISTQAFFCCFLHFFFLFVMCCFFFFFFFSSRRRHTRCGRDWSSDVCSSDLLNRPDVEVRLEIRHRRLLVEFNRQEGLGGYPLGSIEQTLVLMSGGFDSTVAAYQLMRGGLLAHFCFFNLGGRAHELGVMEVAHYLWEKFGRSHRVLFVSVPFEEVLADILGNVDNSQMGIVLKRQMLRAAEKIADGLQIGTLATGEAISQVSSQTLINLSVIDKATDKLVLRPLVAAHKQDIINTAEAIGTAEFAKHMPEYCGVISVNPTTRARPGRIAREEESLNQQLLEQAVRSEERRVRKECGARW